MDKGMRFKFYVLFLIVLCFAVYLNSLFCNFVFDDASAIVENRDIRPDEAPLSRLLLNDFWGTPLSNEESHKSYRPVTVFTFRLNYIIHELAPLGYHLANTLLHGVVTALYFVFLHRIGGSFEIAGVASLLFALHPVHSEAVTGVVGRAELLCALFFLCALFAYSTVSVQKSRRVLCIILSCCFTILGTFSKEQGLTVLGLCLVSDLLLGSASVPHETVYQQILKRVKNHRIAKRIGTLVLMGSVIMLIRLWALKGGLPVFTDFDNPASAASTPIRQLTFNYLLVVNAWLLLCPDWLCADWTMNTVPLISGFADPRLLLLCIFYAVTCCLAFAGLRSKSRYGRLSLFASAWLAIPFVPASNLFFPVGFVVAERVLYIPSMGFCLLIAIGFRTMRKSIPKASKLLLLLTLASFAAKTVRRNADWQDDWTLFTSALRVTDQNAKIYNNLGHFLESHGKYREALAYFLRATVVQTDDLGAWVNVGRTYNNLEMSREAEEALLKAKSFLPKARRGANYTARVAPSHLNVFLNLGNLYRAQSKYSQALEMYRQALAMRPDYTSAYVNLGDVYLADGRIAEAKAAFTQGLRYAPESADLLYNLGIAFVKEGHTADALQRFEMALRYDPKHFQSLVNSALLMSEMDDKNDQDLKAFAAQRLRQALALKPSDATLFRYLGSMQFEMREFAEAEKSYETALALDRSSKTAILNLALIQIELGKLDAGERGLMEVLGNDAQDTKAMLALCDLYVNRRQNMTAGEACYRRVLNVQSSNVQARHNLCILLIGRGLSGEAEECIKEAEKLTARPSSPYTLQHVQVLKEKLSRLQ